MTHTDKTREPLSERDAAWFGELAETIRRARAAILKRQHSDGHWSDTTECDEPLEAELVLLLAFLGRLDDPRIPLANNHLLASQQPDGSWGDLSASVKVYFALKLGGQGADAPHMTRAANAIRAQGGAGASDPLTRAWLALLGQMPHAACAPAPVQAVLLPGLLGGIGATPEWDRAVRVALGLIEAHRPVTAVPETLGVSELFVRPVATTKANGLRPFRDRAVRAATNWLRSRYAEDGPDSSFRALAFTAVALKSLGVPTDDAEMRWVLAQIANLCVVEGSRLRVQPFRTPVRDTAVSLLALGGDAGGAEWLLERDSRPALPCDAETTALVLTALARGGHVMSVASSEVVYPALNRLLAAQNRDGGWPAFDRGVAGDPSCPAITARVLEALGHFGFRLGQPPVDAAVRFVLERQEISGPWRTRWGAGAIQTTWRVFAGLHAVGFDVYGLPVRRAVRWLKESQNADAGWGATPSETAWAVLALLTAGEGESDEVRAGIEFLAGTQRADGTWAEKGFAGTGFGPGTKLARDLDAVCFPLLALTRYTTDRGQPVGTRTGVRRDAGHALAGPKAARHTLAEM